MQNTIGTSLALGTMTLAQIPMATRSELVSVLLGLAALLFIVNQALAFWKNLSGGIKETPPPGQTYQTIKLAEKDQQRNTDEHNEIKVQVSNLSEAIIDRNDALRLELKGDVVGIHTRINNVFDVAKEIKGAFEEFRRKMT